MHNLVVIALLPAVLLTVFIYKKDRVESEPVRLIIKLLALGAVSCVPAALLEGVISKMLASMSIRSPYISAFLEAFAVAALCEELMKLMFLRLTTWRNAAFDYQFDAVVYAVSVSLGFAALENVLYVLGNGFSTGILRAFTSVPGHAIFGVFMGYYYGYAKLAEVRGQATLAREYTALSLLIPILLHGVYDFIAFSMSISEGWILPFFGFVALLYVIGLRRVNRSSAEDRRISPVEPRPITSEWMNNRF